MRGSDDTTLLQGVAAKNRRAFEELYHRYYRRLFAYIFKITRTPELVEEVVNDVMLVIWQSAERFDGRSRPSSWILGIAYRKALKALRRQARRREPGGAPAAEPAAAREGPHARLVRRETTTTLSRALARLPPEQRAVVELTYYQGCSYREIAEIVGCPVNTVKTRMFHARRRLRELLPELGLSSHTG